MGIFGALTTSVAGLRANSYALENISGNIANSQTTAFKRIDTSFTDLIPETGNNAQLAGSVTAGSRSTNTIAGSVQSSSVATYIAINHSRNTAIFLAATDGAADSHLNLFNAANKLLLAVAGLPPLPPPPPQPAVEHKHSHRRG